MRYFARVIAFVLASLPALAQSNPAAHAPLYRIAGTVVNAVTGEPVRAATVAVLAEEDSHRIAATQSGNDGSFAIAGLPAAKYQLITSKRGYVTAAYDEHGQFSSAIVAGEGQDTGNLVFKLMPGAVLRGVVTADSGDPVQDAQVMLFKRSQDHEPGEKIVQMDTATTDDTGSYEFANLSKGVYLLAVKAEPWYAIHSAPARQNAATQANAALDVAYPITYFDSTTDEASASPIPLAGGNRVEADISLHAVPALHLDLEAAHQPDGSLAQPAIRQSIFGAVFPVEGPGLMRTVQTGNTEFSGLPPGQYELTQGDPPRVVELDATTSQQVDPDAGLPAVAVSGTLQTATGEALSGDGTVTLEPFDAPSDDPTNPAQGLKPMESAFNRGAFNFAAVPAGRWKLQAEVAGLPSPVISIAVAGRPHSGDLVTVQDRPLTLVARVSSGGMRVEGFARKAGKGLAGAMVLLIPKDPAAFPDLVRRDQSDSDGSFSLRDAAPGQYTVVAIEDGWQLDWTRPEVIARYLPVGIAVTVTDTLDKVIRISRPVPVQIR